MNNTNQYQLINRARTFLKSIGFSLIEVNSSHPEPKDSFARGCWIDRGILYYCPKNVLVGSMLHEAGHLAILPRKVWRNIIPGCLKPQLVGPFGPGGEYAAEAWGHAAAIHAGIPAEEATRGSTIYQGLRNGQLISDEEVKRINQPGFISNASKAEFKVALQLLQHDHPGIIFLLMAGFCQDFPKMNAWLWDKCPKVPVDDNLINLIYTGIHDENKDVIIELWQSYPRGENANIRRHANAISARNN